MRLLLDSHVFLWAKAAPEKLNNGSRATIADPANEVFVSVVSAWELWIKNAKRPIAPVLDGGPAAFLRAVAESRIMLLDIVLEHAAVAAALPLHHRDPFDRMLIAQAMVEELTIVTVDPAFGHYAGLHLVDAAS